MDDRRRAITQKARSKGASKDKTTGLQVRKNEGPTRPRKSSTSALTLRHSRQARRCTKNAVAAKVRVQGIRKPTRGYTTAKLLPTGHGDIRFLKDVCPQVFVSPSFCMGIDWKYYWKALQSLATSATKMFQTQTEDASSIVIATRRACHRDGSVRYPWQRSRHIDEISP
jgi:hypothetical protein